MKWSSIIYRVDLYKCLWLICLLYVTYFLPLHDTLKHWNNQLYDFSLKSFSRTITQDVVIIAIDDYSLKKLGQWPWPRRQHAELINRLTAAHVKAIGLNLIFNQPNPKDPGSDQKLLQAIERNGRVILPILPEPPNPQKTLQLVTPWPQLTSAAAGLGHIDVEIDEDGVVRSTCLQASTGGIHWPSFALALLSIDEPNKQRFLNGESLTQLSNNPCWQRNFRIEIPFLYSHPRQMSYADVLTNAQLREKLRGKIVIIGITTSGLTRLFKTPLHKNAHIISGSEIIAYTLDTLLNNLAIQTAPRPWKILLTLVLIAIPVACYTFFFPHRSLFITLFFSAFTLALSAVLLKKFHFWYGPIPVLAMLGISYLLWNWQRLDVFTRPFLSQPLFAKAALHAMADGIITTSRKGFIEYMNPAAEQLTGYALAAAKGLHIDTLLTFAHKEHKTTPEQNLELFTLNLDSDSQFKSTMPRFLINHLGEEYAIQIKGTPIKNSNNQAIGIIFSLSDLTKTLQISSKMNHLATHDTLTGLPNRILLQENIASAISSANRNSTYFALLFIDLDGFKKINDGMGHTVGDLLLKEVATRLRTNMRQVDIAARWGGDEFVVLLNQLPNEDTISPIANKILQRLSPPYIFAGQKLYVTPSIGISIFPKDGVTTDTLIAHADAAMYRVKEQGKNNYSFYSTGLNESAKKRLIMEKEMYAALEAEHFEVFYQPQVCLQTHKIVGAEALLRWNHPQQGLIPPDQFIGLAEEIGLINPISEWILHRVCSQQQQWRLTDLPFITLAINLSPRQFLQNDLSLRINQALVKYQLPSGSLKVEITENLMIKDVERVTHMLSEIKALGVSIAIDDFGTGYSSLGTLMNYPIDQLKIDKSFIDKINRNTLSANIVQTIITLGHNMQMDIVAEGVETLTQLSHLSNWQCDLIQGYYFSRPLNADAMTALLVKEKLPLERRYSAS